MHFCILKTGMLHVIKTLTRKDKEPLSYILIGIADGLEKQKKTC